MNSTDNLKILNLQKSAKDTENNKLIVANF